MSVYADIYRNVDFPVLCTRGIIVFPNQDCSIDVGRELSINALNLSRETSDSIIVVITQKDIYREDVSIDNMYSFGTICSIKRMRQDKDTYKVKLHGLARCQINVINLEKDIIKANITVLDDVAGDRNEEKALINHVMTGFTELSKEKNISFMLPFNQNLPVNASDLTDTLGQYMPMELSTKEEFLETLNTNERLYMILDQFNISKEIKEIDQKIKEKLYKKSAEREKEVIIRTQIAALKEELNDGEDDNAASLLDVFENNPYPEHVKEKAREEIKHLESMPSVSSEASMLHTYIEWLRDVPWYQVTEDKDNIDEIAKILDEDHYGLQKVKDRILEYIAVKKLTDSLNAPILCLVGPPGVGKTSLAKSVARALDRKFVKMSLGGVKDEAEIRGHRRTYIGALPGRIIQSMKKAGTVNPVFLIDEIDKLGADYKGDPSSALLEVLDPEQNSMFSDHYLEEQYDLSKVLFIATANDLSHIPGPLMDRLEIIEMNSYTEDEKMHIATDHLLKKQLNANGLNEKQFKLEEDMILYLIRFYTREAGVRELERVIGALCRKVALAITKGERKTIKITKKIVNEYLGKEKYEYGEKENDDQVGVVTGLAYTQFGGDILPIEATHFPGKGGIIMTGNLGDIMKESASIAVGYIKANADKYHIDSSFFEKNDIHIHCPEGAVPKDGPSAGVTMTTAIISAITGRKVSSSIAMTGEVTLRGNVLPIGGLREKSMAAYRSNIHKIIIPAKNLRDLDEIPQVVKDNMTFVPVKSIDDVIGAALS